MKKSSFIDDLPFASDVKSSLSRLRLPNRRGIANWFRKNGIVVALAFVVSILIYIALQEKIAQRVFTVKVVIRDSENVGAPSWWLSSKDPANNNASKKTEVFAAKPAYVKVTLAGAFSELQLLDDSKLEVVVPNSAIKTNAVGKAYLAKLRDNYVKGLGKSNVTVYQIEPEEVFITSDVQVIRAFQIATPRMEILRPLNGHPEIKVEPNQADVMGWASQLDNLSRSGAMLKLAPIQVDGKHASFKQDVEVFPPTGEDHRPLTVSPSHVSVTVNIVPDTTERVVSNLMVNAMIPPGAKLPIGYKLSQTNVAVSLIGEEKSLSDPKIDEKIGVFLNMPASTNHPVKLNVLLRPGVQVSSAKSIPETISLIPLPKPAVQTNASAVLVKTPLPAETANDDHNRNTSTGSVIQVQSPTNNAPPFRLPARLQQFKISEEAPAGKTEDQR